MTLCEELLSVMAPPKSLKVSEWAAENRILNKKTSAFPGRWSNDRTPYAVGIMDAFSDPSVETIVMKAASQVVKTEALLNCIGYAIDMDPSPAMVVYPREEDAETVAINRLHPLIEDCPSLKARLSHRPTIAPNECRFDRMTLWLAASNSPSALASKPIRYLFLDEVNKFPLFSGREADPVKLAMERTKTFWNRKHILCSTPTTEHGYISREFEKTNKHFYFLPCVNCGEFQVLDFKQVKWPDGAEARIIKRDKLAWYECPKCQHHWSDGDKQAALCKGEWRSASPRVGRRQILGFHLSSLYARWISFSDAAAEYLDSREDTALEMNFVNSWLGEDWKDVKKSANADEITKRTEGLVEGQLPPDTAFIVGACDVQQHHVWAAVFAFTRQRRVCLVRFRRVDGEGSTARAISRAYDEVFDQDYEGVAADGADFGFKVRRVAIDSGYATDEVYSFCLRHPICLPFKGRESESISQPWVTSRIDRFPDGKPMPAGLMLYIVSAGFWREHVLRAFTRPIDEPGAWLVHENCPADYTKHVTSWAKKIEKKKNGRTIESWVQLKKDDHGLDCSQYAAALGDILGAKHLKAEKKAPKKYGIVGQSFGGN